MLLQEEDIYASLCASVLSAALGRVPDSLVPDYLAYARREYKRSKSAAGTVELRAACGAWLFRHRAVTYQTMRRILGNTPEWWLRKDLIKQVDRAGIGDPSYTSLLNFLLSNDSADVTLVAAYQLATAEVGLQIPKKKVHPLAQPLLREFGLIKHVQSGYCAIDATLTQMLGRSPCSRSWQTIFGPAYRHARAIAVRARGYADTDMTAWVNVMDTFHDLMLQALFTHDGKVGTYKPGDVGSVLQPTSRFASAYPKLYAGVKEIHERRLESDLSHARVRRTGRRTRPIRFRYLAKARKVLLPAYAELDAKW